MVLSLVAFRAYSSSVLSDEMVHCAEIVLHSQVDYSDWVKPFDELRAAGFFDKKDVRVPQELLESGALDAGTFSHLWIDYRIYGAWVIYTDLITRWSNWVGEVYGAKTGAIFFAALANRFSPNCFATNCSGIDDETSKTPEIKQALLVQNIANHIFPSLPSVTDLIDLNNSRLSPREVQKQERLWLLLLLNRFDDIEPWLRRREFSMTSPSDYLGELVMDKGGLPLTNQTEWMRNFEWTTEVELGSLRHPKKKQRIHCLSVVDFPKHREGDRLFFLNLTHVGFYAAELKPNMGAEVTLDGEYLGGALYLPAEVATKMLADIELLRRVLQDDSGALTKR